MWVVFALATMGLISLHGLGSTRLYIQPQQYGWWYLGAAAFISEARKANVTLFI